MTRSSDSDSDAAENETPRGAPKPEALEDRTNEADDESDIPPEARDQEGKYDDEYGEAREIANPDQHRDEEEYD